MTIRVPSKAISLPRGMMASGSDREEDIAPEPGDPVSFHVEGIVRSCGDGYCEIEPRFINGERPEGGEPKKEAKATKTEEESLEEAAAAADIEEEGY